MVKKEPTEKKKVEKSELPESEEDEITQVLPEEEVGPEEEVSADLKDFAGKLKEMEDKYLRAYADFQNYRKRVAKEKEEVAQFTARRLLKDVLEVKDHLELALAHSEGATDVRGLREGVLLTLKQLSNFLERCGVTEVQPLGEPFNPALHEAVHQEESLEYKPGTVVQVYQKGYLLEGRLLRPARVVVAAALGSAAGETDKKE